MIWLTLAAALSPFVFDDCDATSRNCQRISGRSGSSFAFAYIAIPMALLVQPGSNRRRDSGHLHATGGVGWRYLHFVESIGRHRMSPEISPKKSRCHRFSCGQRYRNEMVPARADQHFSTGRVNRAPMEWSLAAATIDDDRRRL
jgi:hypothetical protein